MAAPKKQRRVSENQEGSSDSENESDISENEDAEMETVMIDFEVKSPEQDDFHGIKNLLQQMFLKAHINVSELANLLIEQQDITGVLKQANDDESMSGDDDDDDINFGVFSVINLTVKRDMECIKQIREYLLSHCQKSCSTEKYSTFKNVLDDTVNHVGLIISERFINIPAKVALPQYNTLSKDMAKSIEKNKPFDFSYYLLICKISCFQDEVYYANPEEELIAEEAEFSFDFEVSEEHDTQQGGTWVEDDDEGVPKRKVLLWPASKWDSICEKLKGELENEQQLH